MIKKVIILVFFGLIIGCAPAANPSPYYTWVAEIFTPITPQLQEACDKGYTLGRSAPRDLGKITINSPRGEIAFLSPSGWWHLTCSFSSSLPKPKAQFLGAGIYIKDLALKLTDIKVSVLLLTNENKEITILLPRSATTSQDNHVFTFYELQGIPANQWKDITTFVIRIERNNNVEQYKFTSSEYSALGSPVLR